MIYISQIKIANELEDDIIEFFNSNLLKTYVWDETRVFPQDKTGVGVGGDMHNLPPMYHKLVQVVKQIKAHVSHDKRFETLQNVEIVKYPAGAQKGWHYDTARTTTTGASITYINDDYIGGHTIIDGVDVQPVTGRTVYFDGLESRHAVSHIVKRDRYTISCWYGQDDDMLCSREFLAL